MSKPSEMDLEKAKEFMNGVPRTGTFLVSRKQMIICAIAAALAHQRQEDIRAIRSKYKAMEAQRRQNGASLRLVDRHYKECIKAIRDGGGA